MDQSIIKNIDEIGDKETEGRRCPCHDDGIVGSTLSPSTSKSNQDYHITQSDNQVWVELGAIPSSCLLSSRFYQTPGIILADGKHYASHSLCFLIPLPSATNIFFGEQQSPSASSPYKHLMLHEMLHVTSKRVNPNVTFFSNLYINLPN